MPNSENIHRIVCTYNHDYTKEFLDVESGSIPRHRLLLLPTYIASDYRVFHVTGNPVVGKIRNWKLAQAIVIMIFQSQFDSVFCTTESSAWYILLMKSMGLLRLPVTVVNVAMLRPSYQRIVVKLILGWLLHRADVVISYATFQLPIIRRVFHLNEDCVQFVKFQVDHDFINRNLTESVGDFILSVGTNNGRDYRTLIQAVGPSKRLIVCTDQVNKDIIINCDSFNPELHEIRMNVPYLELLKLYSECKLFISTLHDVEFSSGQTVLQEALLLAPIVVVSDVQIVRDYITDLDYASKLITVPCGDIDRLRAIVGDVYAA